jgi:osmotically-inducible protein OsmY
MILNPNPMKMNMTSYRSLALLAVAGTLLISGALLRAASTDDRIESTFSKTYVFKTYLKDDVIKAESKDGSVTLTGTVADASHSILAQDTVASLPGVRSVDNQLTVKGQSPAEHSDAWIGLKVKTALLFHRHVSASGTEVFVKDGVVRLRGEASSLAQKELTTEYARDIDHVVEVRNEMTIAQSPAGTRLAAGETMDDASITAQVRSALMSHRSTSAVKTKVETTDGVVTVSGVARNAAEKSLVTKLVGDIHGVGSVVNNMTVEPAVSGGAAPRQVRAVQNLRIVGN